MKTILQIIIVVILLNTVQLLANTILMMPERQGPPGATVQMPIAVINADNVAGVEFLIEYDGSFLEYTGIDTTGVKSDFLMATKDKENKVAVSMARAEGLQQQREGLIYLLFRIRQSVELGTATEITWRDYSLFDAETNPIPCDVQHGVVRVSDVAVYPNPITPNSDGVNDVAYFVLPDTLAHSARVKIFGLAGDIVREFSKQSEPLLQWDGRNTNGTIMNPGVYLYVLFVNDEAIKKGSITIMR
ncbi:gliding motility-associated C-terminal domain-containing protein [candidate division KSB1 bacterium]|nr:gliding motility-associated C-terminal domain-containing protein [candidate division KSB1 bacterium]